MSSNPKARKPHPKPKKPLLPWKGVFALEGDWSEDNLADRTSVVPVLETLERLQIIDYVRRDIGTRAELERYLRRWRDELPDYRVLYLGFHGDVTARPYKIGLLHSDFPLCRRIRIETEICPVQIRPLDMDW